GLGTQLADPTTPLGAIKELAVESMEQRKQERQQMSALALATGEEGSAGQLGALRTGIDLGLGLLDILGALDQAGMQVPLPGTDDKTTGHLWSTFLEMDKAIDEQSAPGYWGMF